MKHANGHESIVVPGSTKKTSIGGLSFVIRCCGEHEESVHIQQPGKHSQAELRRIQDDHLRRLAEDHANHAAAVAFVQSLEEDVTECEGCK